MNALWKPLALTAMFMSSSPSAFEVMTYEEAMQKSGGEKPVVAWVHAVWCGPCKAMEKEGFTDAKVKAHFKDFVLADLEETAEGTRDFMTSYAVRGFPTLIFFSSEGEERLRTVGYGDPESLAEAFEFAASGQDELNHLREKIHTYQSENLADDKIRVLEILMERGRDEEFLSSLGKSFGDIDLFGREDEVRSLRSLFAYLKKDYEKARIYSMASIASARNGEEAEEALGMLYRVLGKLKRRDEILKTAEGVQKKYPESYDTTAARLYYAGKSEKGLDEAVLAAEIWLQGHQGHEKADRLSSRLADAYADQGFPIKAVKIYEELVKKNPDTESYQKKLKRYQAEVNS